MALTLAAALTTEKNKGSNSPITQIVLTFTDAYVKRIGSVGHTFDGETYTAELVGDVSIEWTLNPKFDNASFTVQNADKSWTDLFNTYTAPEVQETTVQIYETFAGLTDRVCIFTGKLDMPKDLSRKTITLTSTQVLNNVTEKFNNLLYSPICQWQQKGLFADAARCTYDAPTTGRDVRVDVPGIDDSATTLPVTDTAGVAAGEYITVGDEIMLVGTVDVEGGTCAVTRGALGTTKAAHIAGTQITYDTCDGSHDACVRRGMAWRFAGLKFFPREGSYFYRQKVFWFISQKITNRWQAQGNNGIFGSPWGVCYGQTRVQATPLYVRDPGAHAVFFAAVGVGPVEGPVPPPAHYGDTSSEGGGPAIIINGRPYHTYGFRRGLVGIDAMDAYGAGWDEQEYSYLWANEPTRTPTVEADETNGQTYSRLAYFAGAFPSDVQTEEGMPDIVAYMKGRRLPIYDADGNVTSTEWTANPAWIFVDMLTNDIYGAGLALTDIDFQTMVAAAAAFDEESFTFNHFFESTMSLADAVQLLCDSTRSYPVYANGKIGLKVIQSDFTATGDAYDESDIIAHSTRFWTSGPHDRDANYLTFNVTAADYDYQDVPVSFSDEDHIASVGGKKKSMSLKIGGITSIAQAKAVGAWHMNLAKIIRRQDGALKIQLTNQAMHLQPGDIISVDASTISGYTATNYLIWSIKRLNNLGNRELGLVKWDTGLFDLDGIDYDTPFSAINPNLEPVNVTDLAATVTEIDEKNVLVTVTWTWTEAAIPHPAPAKVFLFAGNSDDPLEHFDLWTPQGVLRPAATYLRVLPKRYATMRVFAVAQSAFGRPEMPVPRYMYDPDYTTTIAEDLTATDYIITVTDKSLLNVVVGDFLSIPYLDQQEVLQVYGFAGDNDITVSNNGTNRDPRYGTTAEATATGTSIYKLKWNAPYVDVGVVGHVQSIPYVRAYDYLSDTSLAQNQIRVTIPRDDTLGDKPQVLHLQLNATTPFPEPVASPEGADDAYLEKSFGNTILVPSSYDMSAAAGKLFIVFDDDGEKMGRYILSVTPGVTWNEQTWTRVTLNGCMPRMIGTYDWAVWSLWYLSCAYNVNVTLTDAHLNLSANQYDVTITVDMGGTYYLRAYFLTEASISAGVIATDAGTEANTLLHLVGTTDATVPAAPSNVTAYADGKQIIVRWDEPASGWNAPKRYRVRVSPDAYVDDGDGTYSLTNYIEVEAPPSATMAQVGVIDIGFYSVGVIAENMVGQSDYGIYWVEG